MCGIVGFYAQDSVPNKDFFDILFKHAEKRGKDGVGISIIMPDEEKIENYMFPISYSQCSAIVLDKIEQHLKVGGILLGICRNAPETESLTDVHNLEKTLQPIIMDDIVYVHNGAISEISINKYKNKMKTKIDSEIIGLSFYDNKRDIIKTFESISGGWSTLLYDLKGKQLHAISSFIPLAHGFARGLGLIYHSSYDAINEAMAHWFNRPKMQFIRIWEDFYIDELMNYIVETIDIDSGLVKTRPYRHKFDHPTWQQNENNNKQLYIVLASSGIDSTTTMAILKKAKKDVLALHFDYGQKSADAELLAIKKITKELDVDLKIIDLSHIYKDIKASMLNNNDIQITTDKYIKTVQAWTPNRNGLMLNIAAAIAEDYILSNVYDKITICGGFPLISEESVYPDNSERFTNEFLRFLEFSTLAGANHKIKYTNILSGLTKYEELLILKVLDRENLFGMTVSCDNAKVIDGKIYQCKKGSSPACGSGRLSLWAAIKAGIKDTRNYYEVEEKEECIENIPDYVNDNFIPDIKYGQYLLMTILASLSNPLNIGKIKKVYHELQTSNDQFLVNEWNTLVKKYL